METIPDEIKTALNQSYGFVLLIKGKAGTGKTTLALEILKNIDNPIYISTRVKPQFLYEQFPWITDSLLTENIIDATSFAIPPALSLSDDKTFLESLKLKDLPDFLKILFLKTDIKNPGTIIVDSWDAIAALGETQWNKKETLLANYILDLVRQKNYNLVIILETEQESYLDYLVDGIISLDNPFFESDKKFRELHLFKLRGVKINQPSYLFTLNNGRFTCFPPSQFFRFKIPERIPVIEDKNSKISTGIPNFDRILDGGLQSGRIFLIEIHPYLGTANAFFMMPTFIQFGLHDRGVIGLPPPGRLYKPELDLLKQVINNNDFFERFIRIIQISEGESIPPNIISIDTATHQEFFDCVLNFVDELDPSKEKRPYFIIISVDYIPKKFNLSEVVPDTTRIINQLKRTGQIFYLTAMEGNPYIDALKNEVDAHFSIDQINGKPVFYGKNPRTNLFAIDYTNSEGFYDVNLVPIV
jgi:KaiC/GvpD/RAD55 family RecA-like ATPase